MGTTGGLLEVLERCVGLEGFSDGFAALVADFGAPQAVKTSELVLNSVRVALPGRLKLVKGFGHYGRLTRASGARCWS